MRNDVDRQFLNEEIDTLRAQLAEANAKREKENEAICDQLIEFRQREARMREAAKVAMIHLSEQNGGVWDSGDSTVYFMLRDALEDAPQKAEGELKEEFAEWEAASDYDQEAVLDGVARDAVVKAAASLNVDHAVDCRIGRYWRKKPTCDCGLNDLQQALEALDERS